MKSRDPINHPDQLSWIGWDEVSSQTQYYKESPFSSSPVGHKADDILAQLEAVKAGMGIAVLPCFLADTVPGLKRLELITSKDFCGDLWILRHEDLRATARVRVFVDFMLEALEGHRDLLEGRHYTNQPTLIESYG